MYIKKRKLVARNSVYKIYFNDVVSKNGIIKNYLVLDCISKNKHGCGGVVVIPKIKKKYLILKYFNHIHKKWIYTFPGGFVDNKEDIKKAAHRELLEETGIKVKNKDLVSLGEITPIPPLIKSRVKFFVANLFTSNNTYKIDLNEYGKVKMLILSKNKILQIFKNSKNVDSLSMACFFRYMINHDKKF